MLKWVKDTRLARKLHPNPRFAYRGMILVDSGIENKYPGIDPRQIMCAPCNLIKAYKYQLDNELFDYKIYCDIFCPEHMMYITDYVSGYIKHANIKDLYE